MATDKSNMRKTILEFPGQFKTGLKSAEQVLLKGTFDSLLVCGMGGSAQAPDILDRWLKENKIDLPMRIHRDYGLPFPVKEKELIVCVSYSGNTEESLSAFKEARSKNLPLLAIASGGKLSELCQKYKVPLAKIPSGFQPRMALGFQLAALARILANCGMINEGLLREISDSENRLKPASSEVQGKKLAKALKNKIPVIYASGKLKTLARIWKIKFNENSKVPAFWNFFPELNHNEMVGMTRAENNIRVVILKDSSDLPLNLKIMALTEKIIQKRGLGVDTIEIKGYNILDKIFSSLLLADWASYYLALEYGIDPTPVEIVEEFKKNL